MSDIDDAVEMMGAGYASVVIEPPRTVVERRSGKMLDIDYPAWVKFSTAFKAELKAIEPSALKVFVCIALSVSRQNNTAYPGIRQIAEETGLNKDTVSTAVRQLEELGLLECNRGQKGQRTIYSPLMVSANESVPNIRTQLHEVSEPDGKVSELDEKVSERSPLKMHNQRNQNNQTPVFSLSAEWDILHGRTPPQELPPMSQKAQDAAAVADILDEGLRHNFPRGLKAMKVYERITPDEARKFVAWVSADEKRLQYTWTYARDPERIWQDLPQAILGEKGYNPQGLEIT